MRRTLLLCSALLLVAGCDGVLAVPTPTPAPWAAQPVGERAAAAPGSALPPPAAPTPPSTTVAGTGPAPSAPAAAGLAPSPTPPRLTAGADNVPASSAAASPAPSSGGAVPAAGAPTPQRAAASGAAGGATGAAPAPAGVPAPSAAGSGAAPGVGTIPTAPAGAATPTGPSTGAAKPTAPSPPAPAPSPTSAPAIAALAVPPTPAVIGGPAQPVGAVAPAVGGSSGGLPDPGAVAQPTATTPPAVVAPDPAAHGLAFGIPAAFRTGPLTTVGVVVTSQADRVKSFSLRAVYSGGGATATAYGQVQELRPGQSRPAVLISLDEMPSPVESVRIEVDQLLRDGPGPTADAAAKLALGSPTLRGAGGAHFLDVPVRNGDAAPRTASLVAALTKGDQIVGIARGAVDAVAPGDTKTAPLLVTWLASSEDPLAPRAAASAPSSYDTANVAVDVVVP